MRNGIILLAGVCAMAALAAGCGGSGGGDSTVTESSISKSEFIAKADAVCTSSIKQMEVDLATFTQHPKKNRSEAEAAAELVSTIFVPNIQREVDGLRELGAPRGDAKEVQAIIKAREASIAEAEKDPKLVVSNRSFFANARKTAAKYGLSVCATR